MCCNESARWGVAANNRSETGTSPRCWCCCWGSYWCGCCWCCCFALRGGRRLRESLATTSPVCLLFSRGALIAESPAVEENPRLVMCRESSAPAPFVGTPIEAKWVLCGIHVHCGSKRSNTAYCVETPKRLHTTRTVSPAECLWSVCDDMAIGHDRLFSLAPFSMKGV